MINREIIQINTQRAPIELLLCTFNRAIANDTTRAPLLGVHSNTKASYVVINREIIQINTQQAPIELLPLVCVSYE